MVDLHVWKDTLSEAWEESVVETWNKGDPNKTEYDKPEDPPSRDANMVISVKFPQQEPRIHRAFPGSLEDLEIYRQEVVHGAHNHWVPKGILQEVVRIGRKIRHNEKLTPKENEFMKTDNVKKWSYTYNGRLFGFDLESGRKIDQFEESLVKLTEAPHTRRAIMTLWQPWTDMFVPDPACLDLVAMRIFGDELRMNVVMRSNDAFKAAFMNMWAFTDLQSLAAQEMTKRLGRPIKPGSYTHHSISYHIYGSYFKEFGGFLETLKKREFKDRVWNSSEELAQEAFEHGKIMLLNEYFGTDKQLPIYHQDRLYSELSPNRRSEVEPSVRAGIEARLKK